jgi:hypothetical protein
MTMQNNVTVRRIKAGATTVTRQEPAPFKARPMPEPTDCGHGKCAREPACTNRCAYHLAHIAAMTTHTQTPAEREAQEQAQREAADDIRAFQAEADGLKLLATMVLGVFVLLIIGAAVAAWGV